MQLRTMTNWKKFSLLMEAANNKGADHTARMHRLVCAFVVRKPPKTGFLTTRPNLGYSGPSSSARHFIRPSANFK